MIHWTDEMLRRIRAEFPVRFANDLSADLGVSIRSLIRKARELGLEKEPGFNDKNRDEIARRSKEGMRRNPRKYEKGAHTNPAGEFKPGHKESPETKAKRIASLKERAYRDKIRLKYGLKPTTKWPVKDTL